MSRYAIGDIQGCYREFMALLGKIAFNPSVDTLYLVGDIVNRGPESLKVLQWVYNNQDAVRLALGNHDIYLLGRYAGAIQPGNSDTIADILNYTAAHKLIDYLRQCPLVLQDDNYIVVHAGIHPGVDLSALLLLTDNASTQLKSKDYASFIKMIFGNKPSTWSENLNILKQTKFIINACTRMRFLEQPSLALDYKYTGSVTDHPEDLIPWFYVKSHPSVTKTVVFGHWAALGFMQSDTAIALDTGCVWGGKLTAINLDTLEVIEQKSFL